VSNITTLKILVKSEICRACEVNRNQKKCILIPVHNTLHLQRISAVTRAGLVIVEMDENTFRNILDIVKKLELHVGFEQQIKHSGSSERKKTKLD
jgi:uncharacterized pyridoxal phosphate-containing UPF0001 family protein